MGLSRNKVAVSEGAAGSPPFYGESDFNERNAQDEVIFGNSTGRKSRSRDERLGEDYETSTTLDCMEFLVVQLSVILFGEIRGSLKSVDTNPIWGCSSAGRAPALQAGGQGFDSLHLHQPAVLAAKPGLPSQRPTVSDRAEKWSERGRQKRWMNQSL